MHTNGRQLPEPRSPQFLPDGERQESLGCGPVFLPIFVIARPHAAEIDREWRVPVAQAVGVAEDRKSTRLNSSHSQISYAVFCLKKKNSKNMHVDEQFTPNGNDLKW